jgi:hypothetical protein
MSPFDIFIALTIIATMAVYVACITHPQQIGADKRDDHSRPAH